jgi:hypothetical protein
MRLEAEEDECNYFAFSSTRLIEPAAAMLIGSPR